MFQVRDRMRVNAVSTALLFRGFKMIIKTYPISGNIWFCKGCILFKMFQFFIDGRLKQPIYLVIFHRSLVAVTIGDVMIKVKMKK